MLNIQFFYLVWSTLVNMTQKSFFISFKKNFHKNCIAENKTKPFASKNHLESPRMRKSYARKCKKEIIIIIHSDFTFICS